MEFVPAENKLEAVARINPSMPESAKQDAVKQVINNILPNLTE
jgi:hypothetical protein